MHINLDEAADKISQGEVVAVPTETVYGLAASLHHPEGIKKIFTLKGRPSTNPLIVHLTDPKQLAVYAKEIPLQTDLLINAFWPGPLTLVLPANIELIPNIVRAGLSTAAFRIPSHPLTLKLLNKVKVPLAMPSANRSGRPSATCRRHVEEDFGLDFPVFDGGNCTHGVESTIIFYTDAQWKIVRLGATTPEMLQKVLGYRPEVVAKKTGENPICPGQLFRHYAPLAKLILGIDSSADVIIGFVERAYPEFEKVLHLGSLYAPEQAAENLYRLLRHLDQEKIQAACVDIDFPKEGLWQTIHERLMRAAQG